MSNFRPDDEINGQLELARDQEEKGGTKWPSMSYEQGVAEALRWVTGMSDTKPMEG
jgi:hypothetical protein